MVVGAFWAGRDEQGRRAVVRPGAHAWDVIAWAPGHAPVVRAAADLESGRRVAEQVAAELPPPRA